MRGSYDGGVDEVTKPFLVGSVALPLPKDEVTEVRTHRWSVYVRGLEDEDLSYFIKKVSFQLHSSFTPQTRVVDKAPFEVTEIGWGEFEVQIKVYFSFDSGSVSTSHFLQLFGEPGHPYNKPVVSERYDEFIFVDPSRRMLLALENGPKGNVPPHHLKPNWASSILTLAEDEEMQLLRLLETKQRVLKDIYELKQRADAATDHIRKYRAKISKGISH